MSAFSPTRPSRRVANARTECWLCSVIARTIPTPLDEPRRWSASAVRSTTTASGSVNFTHSMPTALRLPIRPSSQTAVRRTVTSGEASPSRRSPMRDVSPSIAMANAADTRTTACGSRYCCCATRRNSCRRVVPASASPVVRTRGSGVSARRISSARGGWRSASRNVSAASAWSGGWLE